MSVTKQNRIQLFSCSIEILCTKTIWYPWSVSFRRVPFKSLSIKNRNNRGTQDYSLYILPPNFPFKLTCIFRWCRKTLFGGKDYTSFTPLNSRLKMITEIFVHCWKEVFFEIFQNIHSGMGSNSFWIHSLRCEMYRFITIPSVW